MNRTLWDTFKNVSYRDITPADFEERAIVTRSFCDAESDYLEREWVTYGDFAGYQLEAFAHQEEPWLEQRERLRQFYSSNNVISTDTMWDSYRSLVTQDSNT